MNLTSNYTYQLKKACGVKKLDNTLDLITKLPKLSKEQIKLISLIQCKLSEVII